MKPKLAALLLAASALLAVTPAPAQYAPPGYNPNAPTILTPTQAQERTTAQVQTAMAQTIGTLEAKFDATANLVTGNPYHLTVDQVVAGFGDAFNAKVQASGKLLLQTIIEANKILGRDDPWLKQPWVQEWVQKYGITYTPPGNS